MIYFEGGREREPQTWRCRIVFEAFHHYNVKKILKNYTKWMVNSLTVWFVAGRGRNRRIWRWNVITNIRGKSAAGEIKDLFKRKWDVSSKRILQWNRVISMEFLRSFLRRCLAGKPAVASPNVGCFLRLFQGHSQVTVKPGQACPHRYH